MRKTSLFLILFFFLSIGFFTGCTDGMVKFIETLQKVYPGLSPYWIQNSDDGPGTILQIVNGNEQKFMGAKLAFPNLKPNTNSIPAFFITETSTIQFEVAVNADDKSILPAEIEAATNVSYLNKTKVSINIISPKMVSIDNGQFTEALMKFDLSDRHNDLIFQELMKPNIRLISGAIQIDGFVLSFDNVLQLDQTLEQKLTQAAANLKLVFYKISENKFTLTAKSPAYLAYYSYPIDPDALKQLYSDIQQRRKYQADNDRVVVLESLIQNIKATPEELKQLKADLLAQENEYKDLKSKADELVKKQSGKLRASELDKINKQTETIKSEIANKNNVISQYDKRIRTMTNDLDSKQKYDHELRSLKISQVSRNEELRKLQDRKYNVLGEKTMHPTCLLRMPALSSSTR